MIPKTYQKRLLGVATALCVVSIPVMLKSPQAQASNPSQSNASQATNAEVVQHMANAVCTELKAGTRLTRAGVRAGKSAKDMGYRPQVMRMIADKTLEEELAVEISDQCPELLEAAVEDLAQSSASN